MEAQQGLVAELGDTILGTGILAADVDEVGADFGPTSDGTFAPGAPSGDEGPADPPTAPGGGGTDEPGDGGEDPDPSPEPPPDEGECGPTNPVECLGDLPLDELLEGGQGPLD